VGASAERALLIWRFVVGPLPARACESPSNPAKKPEHSAEVSHSASPSSSSARRDERGRSGFGLGFGAPRFICVKEKGTLQNKQKKQCLGMTGFFAAVTGPRVNITKARQ
jgi:hypothetical protein